MKGTGGISRRAVLRGLGTAMALPWLEAMSPAADLVGKAGAVGKSAPLRMAFFYVPNGVHMPDWTPSGEGPGFALPELLQPLAPFRDDLLVLTGLTQDGARAHGDGGGDHARSLASFLTGTHPLKTAGFGIKAGVSVDQYAATLASWYGLSSSDAPAVFPLLGNFSPSNLGFLM